MSSAAPLEEAIGRQMVDRLSHRGPDDGCLLVGPNILLGHRRLSILDLSVRGRQPMSDERGDCWISYNGELYNYRELRAELKDLGQVFQSETDTEVILRGYLKWGTSVVERLNGMFAFALWDRRDRSLWLVRDHVGIKPLYYYDDGKCVRFASEIKSLLVDPRIVRSPDWEALDTFLTFGYVAAPASGFAGIRQLMPGEYLQAREGSVRRTSWFRLPYPEHPTSWSAEESTERLQHSLQDAVNRQQVSDVPLGALLSGGLDSSAVVRAMAPTTGSTKTFTVGFDDSGFDESKYAKLVAARYGTSHHQQIVQPDSQSLLPILVTHAEEPIADNSMLPFYLLAQFTRQHVTVALSGDGADELLGGYDTYRATELAPYYRSIPRWLRTQFIRPLVNRLPPSYGKYSKAAMLQRFVQGAESPPLRDHCSWRQYLTNELKDQLYTARLRQLRGDPIGLYAATAGDAPEWLAPIERQLHVDLRFHLANDMLVKVDRMSMAHSLEVRVPFLDLEVIRTCLAMPAQWKRNRGRGKLVLRQMLSKDLPREIIDRKKAGFLIPLERWVRDQWQPLLRRHLTEEFAAETGALQWPAMRQMIDAHAAGKRDYAYPLFALLTLSFWWRHWMRTSPGDLTSGEVQDRELQFPERAKAAAVTRVERISEETPA